MNLSVLPEPFMSGSSGSDTNAEKEGGKKISGVGNHLFSWSWVKVYSMAGVVAMATTS